MPVRAERSPLALTSSLLQEHEQPVRLRMGKAQVGVSRSQVGPDRQVLDLAADQSGGDRRTSSLRIGLCAGIAIDQPHWVVPGNRGYPARSPRRPEEPTTDDAPAAPAAAAAQATSQARRPRGILPVFRQVDRRCTSGRMAQNQAAAPPQQVRRRDRPNRPRRNSALRDRAIEPLARQNGQAQAREQSIPGRARGNSRVPAERQVEIALRPPSRHRGQRETDRHEDPPEQAWTGWPGRPKTPMKAKIERDRSHVERRLITRGLLADTSRGPRGRGAVRGPAAAAPARTSAAGETNRRAVRPGSLRLPHQFGELPAQAELDGREAPLPSRPRRSVRAPAARAGDRRPPATARSRSTSPPVHVWI